MASWQIKMPLPLYPILAPAKGTVTLVGLAAISRGVPCLNISPYVTGLETETACLGKMRDFL